MVLELSVLSHDDFREVFPEEIWELILDEMMVLSVESVEKIRRGSPFFRRLLDHKKMTLLFPQVLGVLCKEGYLLPQKQVWYPSEDAYFPIVRQNWNNRPSTFDLSTWWRRPGEILKLRLVCKVWRKSVDNFYRKTLYRGRSYHISYGNTFEQKFGSRNYFPIYPRTSIPEFMAYFEEVEGNPEGDKYSPFLLRSCTFRFGEFYDEYEVEFMNDISTLLEKYGDHLEKCTFDFYWVAFQNNAHYLTHMPRWLAQLPNLKKLKIMNWKLPAPPPIIYEPEQEPRLRQALSRMETLDDLVLERVDAPLSPCLLHVNSHITRLDLTFYQNQVECALVKELPNLTYLKVTLHTTAQFDHFEKFELNSPLKTLELLLYFVEYPPSRIFYVLEKLCGRTLRNLSLIIIRRESTTDEELKEEIIWDCKKLQKLHLPRVRKLQVDVKESHQRGWNPRVIIIPQSQRGINWYAVGYRSFYVVQVLFIYYFSCWLLQNLPADFWMFERNERNQSILAL